MAATSQKEYLKKYLSIGKAPGDKKKKKKRTKAFGTATVKIIDDDADANSIVIPEEDLNQANEDAPQIVAIIDERPPSMRVDDKKNHLWQPIGSVETNETSESEQKRLLSGFKLTKSIEKAPSSDKSPPRRRRKGRSESPPIVETTQSKVIEIDDNYSPPREVTPDLSPNRNVKSEPVSPSRDYSPPRRNRKSDDSSPPRKSFKSNEDNSPPRKTRKERSPPRRSAMKSERESPSRIKRGDYSPTKRRDHSSPPRRRNEEHSPPSKSRRRDKSPRRKSRWHDSPPRESMKEEGASPIIKNAQEEQDDGRAEKMQKTLDGKMAGLQNAKELIEETRKLKAREDQLFNSMSKEVSGKNASTVLRDRKTGRKRNIAEEQQVQEKRNEEEDRRNEKYARWGRGLAQVENRAQQMQEEIHEMSKPLARYADDEDLERHLKEQERDGDPMLQYIRSKKKKDDIIAGKPMKPQFEGEFAPNRFGIRPGHRWDGVDRSSGYEKKWFDVQNSKQAQQEEAYKWSTEDM